MANNEVTISLKGESPTWGGLVDVSEIAPSSGAFTTLEGAVIGKDGTEIERFPGMAKAATPFYGEPLFPQATTGNAWKDNAGATTDLYFEIPWGDSTQNVIRGHGLEPDHGTVTVYLDVLVRVLNNYVRYRGSYSAVVQSNHAITVTVDSSSWVAIQPESRVYFPRTNLIEGQVFHGLKYVNGYPVVVAESSYSHYASTTSGGTGLSLGRMRALGAWVANLLPDWEDNDFINAAGGITWDYWPNPINSEPMDFQSQAPRGYGTVQWRYPVLFDYLPRRKAVLDIANDDLLIAAPGHGLCHTATIRGKHQNAENITKAVRLLGVPKGRIWKAYETRVAGAAAFVLGRYIWVSVGYRNRFTGEVGLPSEPERITFDDPVLENRCAVVKAMTPRMVHPECHGYSVILYCSGSNGSETAGYYPIKEISYDENKAFVSFEFGSQDISDTLDSWDAFPQYPVLEQMPMGAGWVKTVRGATFYGGSMASRDDKGSARLAGSTWGTMQDNIFSFRFYSEPESEVVDGSYDKLGAGHRVPSSYQGASIRMPLKPKVTTGPFDGSNLTKVTLKKTIADEDATQTQSLYTWEFEGARYSNKVGIKNPFGIIMDLPRGHTWFSEQGHPGITPAINRVLIDLVKGKDIVAAGRIGNGIVLCTEEETYSLAWGRTPNGRDPVLVNDSYGCCAPNSMVEFPGGLAWLSKEGPVVFDGQTVSWAGVVIKKFWDTLRSDSEGMMYQACSGYDQENLRVYWGVRADLNDDTTSLTDDEFSKKANDTIIAFHHLTKTFSIKEQPDGQEIVDFERIPENYISYSPPTARGYTRGQWRVMALQEDGNIYQMDTRFQENATDQGQPVCTTARSGSSLSFVISGLTAASYEDGLQLLITDTTAETVKWWGTADGDNPSGSVTLDSTAANAQDWIVGDILHTNMSLMTMETTFKAFAGTRAYPTVGAVVIHYTLEKDYDINSWGTLAYCRVTATYDQAGQGTDTEHYIGLGRESDNDIWGRKMKGNRIRLEGGFGQGPLAKLKVEILSNCHVKVKDIVLDAGRSG